MDWVSLIIISIVEGVTEFLPISSTGHMIVVSRFLNVAQSDFVKSFEVIIQFGAILAVVVYYFKRIMREKRLWKPIAVATIQILIVGYFTADYVKSLFSIIVVAWMFIVGGIIFLIVEHFYGRRGFARENHIDKTQDITIQQSFLIGLAQITALIPGTSRAGATIIGGMLAGLTRKTATEFSFFVAIPVMTVVAGHDIITLSGALSQTNVIQLAVGLSIAFVVAYATIHFLMRFIAKYSFVIFGWYRIIFGIILLIFFI